MYKIVTEMVWLYSQTYLKLKRRLEACYKLKHLKQILANCKLSISLILGSVQVGYSY